MGGIVAVSIALVVGLAVVGAWFALLIGPGHVRSLRGSIVTRLARARGPHDRVDTPERHDRVETPDEIAAVRVPDFPHELPWWDEVER